MVGRVAFAFLLIIEVVFSAPPMENMLQGIGPEGQRCYQACQHTLDDLSHFVCAHLGGRIYTIGRPIYHCIQYRCQNLLLGHPLTQLYARPCSDQDIQRYNTPGNNFVDTTYHHRPPFPPQHENFRYQSNGPSVYNTPGTYMEPHRSVLQGAPSHGPPAGSQYFVHTQNHQNPTYPTYPSYPPPPYPPRSN